MIFFVVFKLQIHVVDFRIQADRSFSAVSYAFSCV